MIYLILLIGLLNLSNQEPAYHDGTYAYDVAFAEWGGKSLRTTCTVVIEGDSIKVINDGSLSGDKGDIIDEGVIIKHKSGEWIIARNREDAELDEVGGCSEGPSVIDFKSKKFWTC